MFWKNKIVFLTGASSGIGEALAIELAKRGAIVGLAGAARRLAKTISDKIEQKGGTARYFAADVTDAKAVADAADNLRNEFGKIDILIANAGIGGNNAETQKFECRRRRQSYQYKFARRGQCGCRRSAANAGKQKRATCCRFESCRFSRSAEIRCLFGEQSRNDRVF